MGSKHTSLWRAILNANDNQWSQQDHDQCFSWKINSRWYTFQSIVFWGARDRIWWWIYGIALARFSRVLEQKIGLSSYASNCAKDLRHHSRSLRSAYLKFIRKVSEEWIKLNHKRPQSSCVPKNYKHNETIKTKDQDLQRVFSFGLKQYRDT